MDNKNDYNKTVIGCKGTSARNSLNSWLRQRTLGKNKTRGMSASPDLIKRLELDVSLPFGETNIFSPLEWNQQGDLLAGVRLDHKVVGWDVFKRREQFALETGHNGRHVRSFKFVPASNDTKVVTGSFDCSLRLTDLSTGTNSLLWHTETDSWINELAVHPSEPNLTWAVRRDGYISQHDLRQYRECDSYYLHGQGTFSHMAVNPLRSEILAIGSSDAYTCLYDRRALKSNDPPPCIAYFAHVYRRRAHCSGTTNVAFNSDGSELLVTADCKQVHIFNTYQPWEKYQTFELTVEPLLSEKPHLQTCTPLKVKPYSYLNKLRKQCPVEMQDELMALCDYHLSRTSTVKAPDNVIDYINKSLDEGLRQASESNKEPDTDSIDEPDPEPVEIIDYLNVLLDKVHNCADLYRARAIALTARDWYGDSYQALRDCCCALALKPVDFETIRCLSATLIKIGNEQDILCLLDYIEASIEEFGNQDDLTRSREMLQAFKKGEPAWGRKFTSASEQPAELYHVDVNSHRCTRSFDYSRRYLNKADTFTTRGARFFGNNDEFVAAGTYSGFFHIWDKNTTNLVRTVHVKDHAVSVRPHPNICMLATYGSGDTLKLWSPGGGRKNVEAQES